MLTVVFLFPLEVIKLDGTTPVRYGLRLNMDEKYTGLKKQLSELCGLKPEQILLAEVHSSNIKVKKTKKKLIAANFLLLLVYVGVCPFFLILSFVYQECEITESVIKQVSLAVSLHELQFISQSYTVAQLVLN